MPASAQSSAGAASLPSSGLVGVAAAAAAPTSAPTSRSSADTALPSVGACWRGKYEILAKISESESVHAWRGKAVDTDAEVQIRAYRPEEPEIRAQAWAKVGGIDSPHVQHARDAQRVGDWRVEIADWPVGVSLREWRAARPSVDADTVKAIVTNVAEALGALHAFELVHLSLQPEHIYVVEQGPSLHCSVAGLDTLTTFDRKESVPAKVDPLYAPPEAVGLNVHLPGPGLCAWDWWSLGRIVQEIILGQHIVGQLAPGTDIRGGAEALLHEADSKGPRAGAVERMPGLDPQLKLLLRGLLTSAKEARWTGDNVDRWVRGLPVKEHYETPRADTHFRWRGRPYTVPEIAAVLQSSEHWSENSVQLFEPTNPGTLAHFLRWTTTHAALNDQLGSAIELRDALPLKMSSPAAQHEAVTMIALMQLSAGKLLWRGRAVEAETIGAMLTELGDSDALMVLRALITRSTALQIERIDAVAGRFLTELGRTISDVESVLKRYSWIGANDVGELARLFRLAVEPNAALRATRDSLGAAYAGSDHPAMGKLFKAQNISRTELVVLAWASTAPEKFKFFSHAEAAKRRAATLRTRGLELVQALAWPQLEAALRVGFVVLSGWGWFFLTWFLAGAVTAALWPGLRGTLFAAIPVLAALAYRVVVASRESAAVREVVPEARWTWRDGPARCHREFRVAGGGIARATLENELGEIRRELASLTIVQPPPAPLPDLPRFRRIRVAGLLSWSVMAAFLGVAGWRVYRHPVSAKEWKAAWSPVPPAKAAESKAIVAKTDEKSEDVKISWPFKAGEVPVKVTVHETQPATSEQIAYATKHGKELVAPYRAESITTPIVMPVPSGDAIGVMVFDGKRGELLNQQLYLLEYRPIPRTWIEIAERKGIYLDQ